MLSAVALLNSFHSVSFVWLSSSSFAPENRALLDSSYGLCRASNVESRHPGRGKKIKRLATEMSSCWMMSHDCIERACLLGSVLEARKAEDPRSL